MTRTEPTPGPTEPPGDEPPPGVEKVVRIVRDEPLLWPVAVASWLVVCTFGSFIVFYALFVRSLVAGVALLLAIFVTVWGADADIRERRLSLKSALVLSLWAGSLLAALGLARLGD